MTHETDQFESSTKPAEARHESPYGVREKAGRMLWAIAQATLFRLSFPTWYGWRRFVLRRFGAQVAGSARIRRTARFECPWNFTIGANSCIGDRCVVYCLGPITLGDRVSVSQQAHLCAGTHDHTKADMPLLRPPIVIEDDAWIAADAFVGPNVTVRAGAILGARGCAFKKLNPWTVYVGNPAQPIAPRPRPE
jgi:putative colanic acid biosynthesis acetyltransferase WcaF